MALITALEISTMLPHFCEIGDIFSYQAVINTTLLGFFSPYHYLVRNACMRPYLS